MHAASEALLVRNPLQKNRELALLILGECGEQNLLVCTSDASDRLNSRTPLFREVQGITAAIGRILAPFGEPSGFQIVDQRDQPAGDHSKCGGKRLLGDRRSRVEDPQNPGMGR